MQPIHSSIIYCNHGKRRLVPVVVNYYFIHNFHALFSQEAAKSSEFDLTSYAPQQLQIFARSLYNIIMLQNNQNETGKVQNI